MKLDLILKTAIASLCISSLHAQPETPEVIAYEDEEIYDQDILLEEQNLDEWCDSLFDLCTPVGMEGPIETENPPSILDSGTYSREVSFDTDYLEKTGVDAVTIY